MIVPIALATTNAVMTQPIWLGVAATSAIGAVGRYGVMAGFERRFDRGIPWGTALVNLAGAFALGLLVGADRSDATVRLLAGGFLGSFSTFSSWMVEGVFILGSGMSYHNMGNFRLAGRGDTAAAQQARSEADAFDSWLRATVVQAHGERDGRLSKWSSAPGARSRPEARGTGPGSAQHHGLQRWVRAEGAPRLEAGTGEASQAPGFVQSEHFGHHPLHGGLAA